MNLQGFGFCSVEMFVRVILKDKVAVEEVLVFVDELFERLTRTTLLRPQRVVDDVDVELRDGFVIATPDLVLVLLVVSLYTGPKMTPKDYLA